MGTRVSAVSCAQPTHVSLVGAASWRQAGQSKQMHLAPALYEFAGAPHTTSSLAHAVNWVRGCHLPLGITSARDRLLRALGWRVIVVDVHEWKRLPGGSAARQSWLRERLAAARAEDAAAAGSDGISSIQGQLAGTSF